MRPRFYRWPHARAGFSLIELMVVMTIGIALAALSIPAFTSILRATQLTTGAQMVIDQLNLAKQTAVTRSAPVEVRFYRLSVPDDSAAVHVYRGVQSFWRNGSAAVALGKPVFFPRDVIVMEDVTKSSLLATPAVTASADAPSLPPDGTNYQYVSVRFKANGEAVLRSSDSFLTIVSRQESQRSAPQLPANYATVQIDPVNGAIRLFRP